MVCHVDEIVRRALVWLDHNFREQGLLGEEETDTLTLRELARSKVAEAVGVVHRLAPVHLLETGHTLGNDRVYWGERGAGWILLPDDFMRLVVFSMSDWEWPVYTAIDVKDPQYSLQRQRVAGLRGNPQKPVCAVAVRPEGQVLEFYSSRSEDAYVTQGLYMPWPRVDEDDGIDISERCVEAAVRYAAALTALSLGDYDKSMKLEEKAKEVMI